MPVSEINIEEHLKNFIMACRGRTGSNLQFTEKDEWWALGQHFGLHTPLLDWTTSPFVAAYFAFIDEENEKSYERAIYGISMHIVNDSLDNINKENESTPVVEFVESISDENTRLISQGGLFTKSPFSIKDEDIKDRIIETFKGDNKKIRLIKITIPNTERIVCLHSLKRMNITHLALFPDLYGASIYCNNELALKKSIGEEIIDAYLE